MSNDDNRLRGCRVLIAEDEYFLANDLERTFTSHGAKIIGPVSEFDTALHLAKRDHFDVAILDLKLHDQLAYPIADELVRQQIPFVFYTGFGRQIIPERFAGVTVWQKPFDPPELVDTVRRLCARRYGSRP